MNPETRQQFLTQLEQLPDSLQAGVMPVWEDIADSLPEPDPAQPDWLGELPGVIACSDFITGLLRRDTGYLTGLLDSGELFSPLDCNGMRDRLATALAATDDENRIMAILRQERNSAMLQIAFRDLSGWADLDEVLSSLSQCADVLLDTALTRCAELLAPRYGMPIGEETGEPVRLVTFGMGKLGGGELNFSSDVDLIFCFSEHGETDGSRQVSNSEFFIRQARMFIKLIGNTTADGFVYRVDTRLRPNGDSGPLVLSFAAMDAYYQTHGRDWERYAWIKARIVAGDQDSGKVMLETLRPFVYRKYFDFAALESIRDMKEMIERELSRKQEVWRNIKLGPGGIREVEFIAQAHQLIRGGRTPSLQQRSLLTALAVLEDLSLISAAEHLSLVAAYDFLRRTENRLQIRADRQTQTLPESDHEQHCLAYSMGAAGWDEFLVQLQHHMGQVHAQFRDLFMETARPDEDATTRTLSHLWQGELDTEESMRTLEVSGYSECESLLGHIHALRQGPVYRSLSTAARGRLDRLMPVLLHETSRADQPATTMARLIDFLTAISRRSVYLSLLLDNRAVRQQLIRFTSASEWMANGLTRYPILLDELLTGYDDDSFSLALLEKALRFRLGSVSDDDLEEQMTQLREFRHARVMGVASLSIGNKLPAADTGRALSNIAETCARGATAISTHAITRNHGTPAGVDPEKVPFCVIGYGKLGGRELGYGSDLDLVFLSDNIDETTRTDGPRPIYSSQFFARIGQRFVHVMTTRTSAGRLYEVDMRLRPNGNSGPLVATLNAFERYQQNKAWTWEHQALVRARCVAGDADVAERFRLIRQDILTRRRDEESLRNDVISMRTKMRDAANLSSASGFNLKQGTGGIVDIEFMVQYSVLRWACEHPGLTEHTGTIALLDELQALNLLNSGDHGTLVLAYDTWMQCSHERTLAEKEPVIANDEHSALREEVAAIWDHLIMENRHVNG
jgi:glutamate-ammonia-ligase adenylyltransferase